MLTRTISKSKVKLYWRSKLYNLLRMPILLQSISLDQRGHIEFKECDWTGYWEDSSPTDKQADALEQLYPEWRRFIDSGFDSQFIDAYCSSFFLLLNTALDDYNQELIAKLLSFESFYVLNEGNDMPYVAMTTNFRHPLFALLTARRMRKDDKLDSRLLPILTLAYEGQPHQFYSLTKDKLGRSNKHNLIMFLNTGPQDRSICFNALQPLVGILHDEWGEFINKRASGMCQAFGDTPGLQLVYN